MGVSTNAYLFYGFEFFSPENEGEKLSFDIDAWEDEYAARCGIKDTSGLRDEHGEYALEKGTKEFEAAEKRWDEYTEARRRAVEACGCVIDSHCSGDAPIYFVTHKDHFEVATRGVALEIPPGRFKVEDHQIQAMIAFCQRMGIPYREPKWILASYWG
jgi:hypothetical protein